MKKILILVLAMCLPLVIGCNLSKDRPASFSRKTKTEALTFEDGKYAVNVKGSSLYWETSKKTGYHMGGVSLKSGELEVVDGQPQSGSFTIDMDSITNADIEDTSLRHNLINELKSDKYFSVADYPTVRFDITQIRLYAGEGDYDFVIEGDLSLKNSTQTAAVLAKIEPTEKGLAVSGQAKAESFTLEIELSAERLSADRV